MSDSKISTDQIKSVDDARADYDNGKYVDGNELADWVDSWFTKNEKPTPKVRQK